MKNIHGLRPKMRLHAAFSAVAAQSRPVTALCTQIEPNHHNAHTDGLSYVASSPFGVCVVVCVCLLLAWLFLLSVFVFVAVRASLRPHSASAVPPTKGSAPQGNSTHRTTEGKHESTEGRVRWASAHRTAGTRTVRRDPAVCVDGVSGRLRAAFHLRSIPSPTHITRRQRNDPTSDMRSARCTCRAVFQHTPIRFACGG